MNLGHSPWPSLRRSKRGRGQSRPPARSSVAGPPPPRTSGVDQGAAWARVVRRPAAGSTPRAGGRAAIGSSAGPRQRHRPANPSSGISKTLAQKSTIDIFSHEEQYAGCRLPRPGLSRRAECRLARPYGLGPALGLAWNSGGRLPAAWVELWLAFNKYGQRLRKDRLLSLRLARKAASEAPPTPGGGPVATRAARRLQ